MTPSGWLDAATRAIADADGLIIGAGAGMGVDSGLPDFRGNTGFWKAYPPFAKLGYSFYDLANPTWFRRDPSLAWGFYGHRMHLYRDTAPHAGFEILRRWASMKRGGAFVFTSNIDGQFQRAGFSDEAIVEVHGSLRHLQCTQDCRGHIWPATDTAVSVHEPTMRAQKPLPTCPACGALARPNVLMFGDGGWNSDRSEEQHHRFRRWLATHQDARLAIIECGAGTAVPTVRATCEHLARAGWPLIRVNPREPQGPADAIAVPEGALGALTALDDCLV
ncbi:MAG: NAD-dependent SIR2 family protein deacetylase [Myxococcota bacterium]